MRSFHLGSSHGSFVRFLKIRSNINSYRKIAEVVFYITMLILLKKHMFFSVKTLIVKIV